MADKRKGVAGETGPKNPGGDEPRDNVRQLQRQLWAAAKRAPGRRFHALYDHLWRDDILREAWRRVRSNRGAAGIDRVSIGSLRFQRAGRHLRAGQAQRWDREYFETLGLHRLRGTIRYPGQTSWQQESA